MATRSMVMCDADAAVGGGVLDLGLVICAETTGAKAANAASVSARSAVVSNLVLVGFVAFLFLLLALLWTHLRSCSVRIAMRELCLPSTLLPVCTVVLPSTAASLTLLAARLGSSPCTATDALLVVCGSVLVFLPPGVLIVLWRARACSARSTWICVQVDRPASTARRSNDVLLLLRNAFRRNWKWSKAALGDEGDGDLRSAWVVLLEYRVVWYPALDSAMLAAVAALAVAGGLDPSNADLCRACGALVVILIAAQLVVLALTRPFTTLFSLVHAALSLSLACLSAVAQLIFVQASSTDTSGLWLAQFSAACDLAVVGVTALRLLFDVSEIVTAFRRRVVLLCIGRASATGAPVVLMTDELLGELLEDDVFGGLLPAGPTADDDCLLLTGGSGGGAVTVAPSEDVDLREAELDYWDADGCAILRTERSVDNEDGAPNELLGHPDVPARASFGNFSSGGGNFPVNRAAVRQFHTNDIVVASLDEEGERDNVVER